MPSQEAGPERPMSSIRGLVLGCVSDRSQVANKAATGQKHYAKVKFGVPLSEALKDDNLPLSLVELLVYIAQEGVATTDLFRRNGNPNDARVIMKKLAEGREIILPNYNFYTLASVVKKFLLKIPDGLFGAQVERNFLKVLEMQQRIEQYEQLHSIITSLPQATQQLMALLFGTWFRIVNHSEFNTMSSEAVAKSVAGSLFHTCAEDPEKIQDAVKILQILIDDFGVANMFGRKNIQYFADRTRTDISVKEKYQYRYGSGKNHGSAASITEEEFYGHNRPRSNTRDSSDSCCHLGVHGLPPSPQSLQPQPTYHQGDCENANSHQKLTGVSSLSAPEVHKQGRSPTNEAMHSAKMMYQSNSLSRFDHVRRRQLLRMRKRSNWFLAHQHTPHSQGNMDTHGNVSMDTHGNMSMDSSERSALLGSRDVSLCRRSYEAGSSEAIMSDMTTSDGGLSDTPNSERIRLSSDSSYLMVPGRSRPPPYESLPRAMQQPDLINGNHAPGTPPPPGTMQRRRSTPTPPVTERDVRCFMQENFYGSTDIQKQRSNYYGSTELRHQPAFS